ITGVDAPSSADFNGSPTPFSTSNTATTVTLSLPGPLVLNGVDGTVTLPSTTVHVTAPAYAATVTSYVDGATSVLTIDGGGGPNIVGNVPCPIPHVTPQFDGISSTTVTGPAKPPPAPASITVTPNTELHANDTAVVNGLHFTAQGAVIECNGDPSQPTVQYGG